MTCRKCRNTQGKRRRKGKTKPCPVCRPKPSAEAVVVKARWYVPAHGGRVQ